MPKPTVELKYGDHQDQLINWRRCHQSRGTIILVHGGYWREKFTLSLMEPLSEMLLENGWDVFNIEYRRGKTTSAEQLLADADAAFTKVRQIQGVRGPVISVGHSVGGQLALLNADQVEAVVALAPVTDLVRTRDERLGENAVREFFGQDLALQDQFLRDASPINRLPKNRTNPILVVHGQNDTRVPVTHHENYIHTATAGGLRVDALTLAQCSHLDLIDPKAGHWNLIKAWIDTMTSHLHQSWR